MTTTLCGHERADLVWALDYAIRIWSNDDAVLDELVHVDWRNKHQGRFDALCTIIDPAKLAELMAEELRRRGVDADGRAFDKPFPLDVKLCADGFGHWLTIAQARAGLLCLMQLPEGTAAQDVLKALEVAP